MGQDDEKYILKKLMQDALAEEEQAALNDRKTVKRQMFSQWENAPDAVSSDRADGKQIWYHICLPSARSELTASGAFSHWLNICRFTVFRSFRAACSSSANASCISFFNIYFSSSCPI